MKMKKRKQMERKQMKIQTEYNYIILTVLVINWKVNNKSMIY